MYNDGQEHKIGDLVIVKKWFWEDGDSYVGMKAIISGTYASQYGGNDHESLSLTFEDGGSSSWWYASKLELIQRDCSHLIDEWKAAAKTLADKHSDLDFIFANLDEVLETKYTASIQSVYSYLGGAVCGVETEK